MRGGDSHLHAQERGPRREAPGRPAPPTLGLGFQPPGPEGNGLLFEPPRLWAALLRPEQSHTRMEPTGMKYTASLHLQLNRDYSVSTSGAEHVAYVFKKILAFSSTIGAGPAPYS